jgi:hypothetical protein
VVIGHTRFHSSFSSQGIVRVVRPLPTVVLVVAVDIAVGG